MPKTIVIDPRFNGPPDSANGGYTCGLLGTAIDGAAQVTLRQPPPLERELVLGQDGTRVLLLDGDSLVAEAEPVDANWKVPAPVSIAEAESAPASSPFLQRPRPFVTCFVCGPDRHDADPGLRIFPGPVEGRDVHAGTWTPDPALADQSGLVEPEIVWASLDCPTSGPVATWHLEGEQLRPIVLARLAVELRQPVHAGEPHVIVAWPIEIDGRKRHSGAALFNAEGDLLASSRALWIELKPQ